MNHNIQNTVHSESTGATVIRKGFIEMMNDNKEFERLSVVLYENKMMKCIMNHDNTSSSVTSVVECHLSNIKSIERTNPTTFEVKTGDRVYKFRCHDESECDEWFGIMLSLDDNSIVTEPTLRSDHSPASPLIHFIDSGLSSLYNRMGHGHRYLNSDGMGLFAEFCITNGFNDETITKQLDPQNKDQCVLIEFDPEFPFNGSRVNRNIHIFDTLYILYQQHNRRSAARIESICDRNKIDLSIYEEPEAHCRPNSDHIPITECCDHTKRLCTASRYFHVLSSTTELNEEEKQNLFVKFKEKIYPSLLDDSIHFVKEHGNDIERVHSEWTELYGLPKCIVSECAHTKRHYARGRREQMVQNNDGNAMYSFYESVLDRIHHFVFHLFEIGLRVNLSSVSLPEEVDDEKDTNLEGVSVDKWFAAEREHIKMCRQKCKLDMDRYNDPQNKFTMQTLSIEEGGLTLMDALFQKLSEVQTEALHRIKDYFDGNSFDSECIEMDIEDVNDSNISKFVENEATVQTMTDFIRTTNRMSVRS